ncbi:DUF2474 family protein [Sulfitobacter sp.]
MSLPLRKLGWFIGIWLLSVAALGVVAFAIRLVLYG